MEIQEVCTSKEHTVAVLIDMQPIFIDTEEKRNLISRQIVVLNECRKQNIPVISIQHARYRRLDVNIFSVIRRFPERRCVRIKKSYDNAFKETSLQSNLVAFNAKVLLVMGVNASLCVYDTLIDALSKNYTILTSEDLISGYFHPKSMMCECKVREWYASQTLFLETHEHVVQLLNQEK